MKVEIDSAALAAAVAWTTRVIDARPASPILAGIQLEAIDGTLQLSAFNYEISARHHIEAGIDEPGILTGPMRGGIVFVPEFSLSYNLFFPLKIA